MDGRHPAHPGPIRQRVREDKVSVKAGRRRQNLGGHWRKDGGLGFFHKGAGRLGPES